MKSSQKSIDMIVNFEITSSDVYEKLYQRPVWPGGSSGVTVGIGYDLGAQSPFKIVADWSGQVPGYMINAMRSMAGIHGIAAKVRLTSLVGVVIPLAAANAVFSKTLAEFETEVLKLWPATEALSGDSFGALVSLVYNRGFDCNPVHTNRGGMADLSDALSASNLTAVPGIILAMCSIWQGKQEPLVERRKAEAALFEAGLTAAQESKNVV